MASGIGVMPGLNGRVLQRRWPRSRCEFDRQIWQPTVIRVRQRSVSILLVLWRQTGSDSELSDAC